jgi:hypothetical protein
MGIFDFLKKFKKEEPEIRKIAIDELLPSIKEELAKTEGEEKLLIKETKEKTSQLTESIEQKIIALKQLDLDQKKADTREKFIVKENFEKYLNNLDRFIEVLDQIKEKELEINRFIKEVNAAFEDFEKKSYMNYQKATFLIGKELGEVREKIISFFTEFKKTLEDKKEFFEKKKTLDTIKEKLDELENLKEQEKNINSKIKDIDSLLKDIEENKKEKRGEIDKIKQSEDYKKEQEQENKIKERREQLTKQTYNLKQKIDFKFLSSIYHPTKKHAYIKQLQSNFQENFEKNPKDFKDLIEDTNLEKSSSNKEEILEEIDKVVKESKNISKQENELDLKQSAKLLLIEDSIKKLDKETEDIGDQRVREGKRVEKIDQNKKAIIEEVKNHLPKINMELSDN